MYLLNKSRLLAVLHSMALATALMASTGNVQPAMAQSPSVPNANRLTPSELDELLGPIALYPDPLLANVLAASVYPEDVAAAAKFAAGKPTTEQIDAQPWEDPVKAVAEFPDVIKMMGDFPDWTIALGQAYLTQAKDVMDVVQTLRKKSQDNGTLVSTPQQTVVVEQKVIYIQPADPQIIYVPVYKPAVVYAPPSSTVVAGAIGFGLGITAGLIIANNMDCHWHSGCVGWGWGRCGPYWGHHNHYHKSSVKVTNNINVGDVNIGNRGDVNIKGGDTKIKGGDRTNINIGDRNASKNREGNEGNAWAPDRSKKLATSLPSESGKMKGQGSNKFPVPDSGSRGSGAGINRPSAGGDAGAKPSLPAQRPSAATGAGTQGGAKPAQLPAQRPAAGGNTGTGGNARPQAPARSNTSENRPSGGNRTAVEPPRPTAFDGGGNQRNDSSRGTASRQSATGGGGGNASRGGNAAKGSGPRKK